MASDIVNTVKAREKCLATQQSIMREPLVLEPTPTRIFEDVSVDLFSHSKNHYLIYVDRLSGWPTIDAWLGRDVCTRDINKSLSKNFSDLGVPVTLRSDGGPQFTSAEFSTFLKRWGVNHVFSTPHYPQSNGLAEAGVKAMKTLVMKTTPTGRIDDEAFRQGLLEWRNSPKEHGISPSEIVFGHPLRSVIPAHHSSFSRKWKEEMDRSDKARERGRIEAKRSYD